MFNEKYDWKVGDIITADRLNKIETNLFNLIETINTSTSEGIHTAVNSQSIILQKNNWVLNENQYKQTVTVNNLVNTDNVIIAPHPGSYLEYARCEIRCIEQGNQQLTFKASEIPKANLTVNLMLLYGVIEDE